MLLCMMPAGMGTGLIAWSRQVCRHQICIGSRRYTVALHESADIKKYRRKNCVTLRSRVVTRYDRKECRQ